jgi:hypothetical protein
MKENLFVRSIKTFNPCLMHTTLLDFVYFMIFFAIGIAASVLLTIAFDYSGGSYALFVLYIILITVAAYSLIVLNMAFFKNIVWNITLNEKRRFKGFLIFTAIWTLPWLVIFYLMRNTLPEQLQIFILTAYALIYLHFTAIARLSYKKSVKKAFLNAFEIGFWKFPRFAVPYLLILAVVWVTSFLTSFFVYIGTTVFIVVSVAAFFTILAWSRYYISLIYSKIK